MFLDSIFKESLTNLFDKSRINDASVFLENELTKVETTVYKTKFPELLSNKYIPLDPYLPEWAQYVEYHIWDNVGSAKFISNYGDDLPRVDLNRTKVRADLWTTGNSFAYNNQELIYAQHLNINLESERAIVAKNILEKLTDTTAWLGNAERNFYGLLNHPSILLSVIANGASGSKLWSSKTRQEKLKDLVTALETIRANIKASGSMNGMPDTILLPSNAWSSAASNVNSYTERVDLDFLKTNLATFGITTIETIYECDGAGVGGTDRAVIYKKDPKAVAQKMVYPFKMENPQMKNFEAVINCSAKIGGTVIKDPYVMAYLDGI